jgi:hypothetical protein
MTLVSLVATVSSSGRSLKPFFVTSSRVDYRDPELALMRNEFATTQTAKGYLTIPTMQSCIESVMEPYCQSLRTAKGDPELPIDIILDNCRCPNTPEALGRMHAQNIRPIWLPQFDAFSACFRCPSIRRFRNNLSNYSAATNKTETGGEMTLCLEGVAHHRLCGDNLECLANNGS